MSSKYLIGIDLGTTNCTMAYASIEDNGGIEQFPIAQITSMGAQQTNFSLPSFIYFPLEDELKSKIAAINWNPSQHFCVGAFAQSRGAELPNRLISSAKSWLCHSGINRRDPILPIDPAEDISIVSPLQACAELLKHLKGAWDQEKSEQFDQQQVLITVPASFDPSARQLVIEAASLANYPEVILLEEPQAAFYAWLHVHSEDWRKLLKVNDSILVIDIGGGTSDFSLIGVGEESGNLNLKRLAVGSHLLLGGDNIDLALAHFTKNKLEDKGHTIEEWQLQSLIHQCRKAKETLLSENPPPHVDLTIMGRGSKLIGGSLKVQISLDEVQQLVINGFCPLVPPQDQSTIERRLGLQQLGLPYAQDPRFTCQLAKFLSMTGESEDKSIDHFHIPTTVLFNGGTTKAAALRQRIVAQLNEWAKVLGKPAVKVLTDADYDFAVSRGAVNYGKARQGQAIRIKSGTSRSYFVGVEESVPAIPGLQPCLKAVCIAPFGMEEGSELKLENQKFALVLGESAIFRFFSHSTPTLSDGKMPTVGTIVKRWKQELTELSPIEAHLPRENYEGKTINIHLRSRVTELGVLELWCMADNGREWKLEFNIRNENNLIEVK